MNASQLRGVTAGDAAPAKAAVAVALAPGRDDFDRDVWSIFGLPLDLVTAPEAVQLIETAARDRRPLSFATPNVNFLVRATKDAGARRLLLDTDLNLVDGAPLVVLGRLIGAPVRERCAGSDLFDALRRRAGFPGRRLRVFFFGGRDGAAEAAARAIDEEKRGVEAAGFFNPGHGDLESMSTDEIIGMINRSRADFVVVALGAAKGQAWIDRNRTRLDAPIVSHLGAVVDFAAGSIRRAPSFVRRAGLEWAWRIKEEPSLWRRYWNDGIALASIALFRLAPARATARVKSAGAARAGLRTVGSGIVLALEGDLIAATRASIRPAFRAAAAARHDIILDLSRAATLDASFLGLVLMLEKAANASGRKLRLSGASRAHRRIFNAHSMNYADADVAETTAADDAIAAAV
jgi:N-acetylglucosaminyldiphosphoundecaprenol N-acetyl-beta-D-mannosaminyltransferase